MTRTIKFKKLRELIELENKFLQEEFKRGIKNYYLWRAWEFGYKGKHEKLN